jgi:hypothetical protein
VASVKKNRNSARACAPSDSHAWGGGEEGPRSTEGGKVISWRGLHLQSTQKIGDIKEPESCGAPNDSPVWERREASRRG